MAPPWVAHSPRSAGSSSMDSAALQPLRWVKGCHHHEGCTCSRQAGGGASMQCLHSVECTCSDKYTCPHAVQMERTCVKKPCRYCMAATATATTNAIRRLRRRRCRSVRVRNRPVHSIVINPTAWLESRSTLGLGLGPGLVWARTRARVSSQQPISKTRWLSGGRVQRQIMLQAAPSFDKPRPISLLGGAGRPDRRCFRHGAMQTTQ